MPEANVFLLGRHLTNSSIVPHHHSKSQIPPSSTNLPSWGHHNLSSFTKINIPNNCINYRKEDIDVQTSAMVSQVDQVSIGSDFIMILLSDGSLYSMGINRPSNHLGFTDASLNTFEIGKVLYINSLKGRPVKMIASGAYYTIVVTRDDDLYGIGSNDYGQFHVDGSSTHKNNATPYFIDYGKTKEDKM